MRQANMARLYPVVTNCWGYRDWGEESAMRQYQAVAQGVDDLSVHQRAKGKRKLLLIIDDEPLAKKLHSSGA